MFKKPFPLTLQHDSMECGIACLSMICKYHGREYSTRYLSRLCFATTEGVSLLGITEAAKALGLKTVAARVSVDELRELPLPCILHWKIAPALHTALEPAALRGALPDRERRTEV